MNYKA